MTDLHVFLLGLFHGEGAATGLVSCGYLGGLGFLDRAHDICYRREEPFICVASIQIEQYRNLKSKDSDLLYNLPPCSLSVASNPFFFGTSRASAKADFKAQWSLGPLELLCQSMRGSICAVGGTVWDWQRSKSLETILVGICWHFFNSDMNYEILTINCET